MQSCPKPCPIAFVAAMVVPFLLIFSISQGFPAEGAAVSAKTVSGVDDFIKNVDRYPGKVILEGVVSAVAPDQQAISLIDAKEFQACGVTTCAQLTLPVQWRGPLPAIGDLVKIEGQAQEVKGKLMFVADKLEKVTHP